MATADNTVTLSKGPRPSERPASALFEVMRFSKRFGEQEALSEVGFSVRSGEVLGLIGPNGAGKTTLLEALTGVLPVDSGTLLWTNIPLAQAHRRDFIFFVPDGMRPYGDQYVERVLEFFAVVYRRSMKDVADVVAMTGLVPALAKRVNTLSKGFNRRLMLSIGLLTPHPVLLMDEPFDGFDLKQTREMMELLRRVAANGRTLLLSIHQLNDAERVCDRFVLLANGRVRGTGTLEELRAQTGTGATSASLEDVFLALT